MQRLVTTRDGAKVLISPDATDGHPDYGHEDYRRNRRLLKRIFAHQDMIRKVLDDHDLWSHMGKPGRMATEYRNIRKADPLMPELIKLVKLSVRGKLPRPWEPAFRELVVDEELRTWPFPGPIMKGAGIENSDWIIDQEMKEVWAYALENTNASPYDPESPLFEKLKGLSDIEQQRLVAKLKVKLYRGDKKNKIILPPSCAIRFTLFDDPEIPRDYPNTRLVRYDPANPKHNPELRTDGVYADMHAYVADAKSESQPAGKRKVMKGA